MLVYAMIDEWLGLFGMINAMLYARVCVCVCVCVCVLECNIEYAFNRIKI